MSQYSTSQAKYLIGNPVSFFLLMEWDELFFSRIIHQQSNQTGIVENYTKDRRISYENECVSRNCTILMHDAADNNDHIFF
jgi:hypothetical protein